MSNETKNIAPIVNLIFDQYGYDFRDYAPDSFRRRLENAAIKYHCKDFDEIAFRIKSEPLFFGMLLSDLTITVTEMFRDPEVYRAIREQVVPYLRTYPELRIWVAGCAGGEEAYSLAILLNEENLYERSIIYATDINPAALKRARQGILSLDTIQEATQNYFAAGGRDTLHTYYIANYDAALLDSSLRRNIVFSDHNLASDAPFGEMHLILCRNVLIYFNQRLHERAFTLFATSLCPGGFLCLGNKETISFSNIRDSFVDFQRDERIYRKSFRMEG